MKICIDPGHGGFDSGAVNNNSSGPYLEKVVVLEVSKYLKDVLESNGHIVKMTRSTDRYVGLTDRADIANTFGADYFLSIHANSFDDSRVSGVEVFHFPGSLEGKSISENIYSRISTPHLGITHKKRGVKEAAFSVLRHTKMPAALIELEFISNLDMAKLLYDPRYQKQVASEIAETFLPEIVPPNITRGVFKISGTVSSFGGPDDEYMTPTENTALVFSDDTFNSLSDYFLYRPENQRGYGRALNPEKYYCAARWDYNRTPKGILRNTQAIIINPETNVCLEAQPIDWGPNQNTGRSLDLSPAALRDLGLRTNDEAMLLLL